MTKKTSYIFCLFLIISLSGTVASSQELTIVSSKVGECSLSVESNEKWNTLRLRAHHPKYSGCQIDKDSVLSVLSAAFSKTESPRLEGSYSSLSIGRLIDYPWLSQYLATTAYRDRGWDSKKGKPVTMDINKYAKQLLLRKELIIQIEAAFTEVFEQPASRSFFGTLLEKRNGEIMKKPLPKIVIPKEAAVFFLDEHGHWRQKEQGKFERQEDHQLLSLLHSKRRKRKSPQTKAWRSC